jgi:hypothetical protein
VRRAGRLLPALLLLAACSATPTRDEVFGPTEADRAGLTLAYASDYLSFVGWDDAGAVAFAIDTNRGRDGGAGQAEHFLVLYDEASGWREVAGNGAYPNPDRVLEPIPDSTAFTFTGTPETGLTVASTGDASGDGPRLTVEPVRPVIDRRIGIAAYRMGSAPATLAWNGRTVRGRVIHEHLFLPGFNRLSRRYAGLFGGFSGLYAVVDTQGDLYLHHHEGGAGFMAELAGADAGFLVLGDTASALTGIDVKVAESGWAAGLYRWPKRWRGSFSAGGREWTLDLTADHRHRIGNWVVGGFAMAIVTGTLERDGERYPVFGLGELIM